MSEEIVKSLNGRPKLLVFDTHPVQYRVPIWQTMNSIAPGCIHVAYASDCSVKGHADPDFEKTFSWDEPLLAGYDNTILNCERGVPLSKWNSLTGKGVKELIQDFKPKAILLTGFNFKFDLIAYAHARQNNIPVWLRYETQDFAFTRTKIKFAIRWAIYRAAYLGVSRMFYIGQLNMRHYLRHGVSSSKLRKANYGTVDRCQGMTTLQKTKLRIDTRTYAGIPEDAYVIGFSGKFIEKKNPRIIFDMVQYLPENIRKSLALYFIGSGPLSEQLRAEAAEIFETFGITTHFAGFINQTQLVGHYLAMDLLVLPSRKMGETWGLVVNEAMQAGCSVAISDAVGCAADFADWERVRVFKEGSSLQLSEKIAELCSFPLDFDWAAEALNDYSINETAKSLVNEINAI